MKHLLLALTLLASPAAAGGPVITTEEPPVLAGARDGDGGFIIPLVVGLIALCAIACGSDGGPVVKPDEPCNGPGEC